ncbi:hypothetical protein MNBD_ALPHA09-1137 [hydrothermal vent metagenome]|uniref:Mlr0862 protein n=1 Tax=hydrothermal vent metagenome TaxID=652676 RepID=A0A3B0U775_9ZZZZ
MTTDEAERIAIDVLAFLAGDEKRLHRFVAMTGIDMDRLRQAAREPAFLAGVLAHVAGDERTLIDFAAASGHSPDAAAAALRALGGHQMEGTA